jgi:hypothetical protein
MHGRLGRLFGKYTEEMFFQGDQSALNPMRYIPTPFHTKLAQQRTALSQYIQQEAIGTPMRRWDRSIHDFLAPYVRGAIARVTGDEVIPREPVSAEDGKGSDGNPSLLSYVIGRFTVSRIEYCLHQRLLDFHFCCPVADLLVQLLRAAMLANCFREGHRK